MDYKFLVSFGNSNIRPVVFDTLEMAKKSWEFSYSKLDGYITFTQENTHTTSVTFTDEKSTEIVGNIRQIEHYTSVTHL